MLSKPGRGLCLALAASIVLASSPLWAEKTSTGRRDEEQILLTEPPGNTLSRDTLSRGLEGLGIVSTPSFSSQAAPQIPVPGSFWTTAESGLFTASLVSFAAMNVADYFLTREAMTYPGMSETNPLLRPIVKSDITFALYKASYIVLNSYFLSRLHGNDKPLAWALSLASNLLVSLAVSHNLGQLDRVKGR